MQHRKKLYKKGICCHLTSLGVITFCQGYFPLFPCFCVFVCLFCCICSSETEIFDREGWSTWLATETLLMCLFRLSCSKPSSLFDFRSFCSRRHNCFVFWVFKLFYLGKTLFRYWLQCLSNNCKNCLNQQVNSFRQ